MSLGDLIAALGAALAEQGARARALRGLAGSPPRPGADDKAWVLALARDGLGLADATLRADDLRAQIEAYLGEGCDCPRHAHPAPLELN